VIDLGNEEYDFTESCSADTDSSNNSFSVSESAPYTMTSQDSASSATIVLQRISQLEDKVNLVCNFSSSLSSLLSDSGCLPEIYLVSGHNSCSDLPQTVTAKKLAEIHQTGAGQTLVDLSWSELTNTCVIIVKKVDCSSSVIETRNSRQGCSVLKSVGVTRTFSSLSMSGLLVLLSGSSVILKVLSSASSSPSVVTAPIYNGLTVTSYDKWSTLPILQLPGMSSSQAILLVLALMASYILGAYILIQYPNIPGIKKRVTSKEKSPPFSGNHFLENYSQLGDRIFDMVDEGLYQQEKMFDRLMGFYFRKNKKL